MAMFSLLTVSAAVAGDGTEVRAGRTRVVRAVRLDHIVLDQRVGGPAVEGYEAVACSGDGAGVSYRAALLIVSCTHILPVLAGI